jgi:hypothetical protein
MPSGSYFSAVEKLRWLKVNLDLAFYRYRVISPSLSTLSLRHIRSYYLSYEYQIHLIIPGKKYRLSQAFSPVDWLIKCERLRYFLFSAGHYGRSDSCGDWCNLLF